jgi:hypothetical protein
MANAFNPFTATQLRDSLPNLVASFGYAIRNIGGIVALKEVATANAWRVVAVVQGPRLRPSPVSQEESESVRPDNAPIGDAKEPVPLLVPASRPHMTLA